jgi:hypothetical protein
MRISAVIIIALAILGFLAGAASAGKIKISGTHSADEVRSTCANVGGSFLEGGGAYSCLHSCGGQECRVATRTNSALALAPNAVAENLRCRCSAVRMPLSAP